MNEIAVSSSKKNEIIDITKEVEDLVFKSKAKDGFAIVYVPHATCALMINENYDPNVLSDILSSLSSLIPDGKWKHDKVDGNGAAHIKASIIGPSEVILIKGSKLMLGQWQSIMLADFDGPRKRSVFVKIVSG